MGLVDKIFKAIDHPAFELVLFGAAAYNMMNHNESDDPKEYNANRSLDSIIAKEGIDASGKSPKQIESDIDKELSRKYRTKKGIRYNVHKRVKLLEAYYTEIGRDIEKEHARDFLEIMLYGKHPKTIEYEPGNFVTKSLYTLYDKMLFRAVSAFF